jgi:hypothetical protein
MGVMKLAGLLAKGWSLFVAMLGRCSHASCYGEHIPDPPGPTVDGHGASSAPTQVR